MKNKQQKIALVVSKPFGNSETFFYYDYQIWQELGFIVKVFPIQNSIKKEGFSKIDYCMPPTPMAKKLFLSILQVSVTLIKYLKPRTFLTLIRFGWFEKKENVPLRSIIRKAYSNYHILNAKNIDHLFFGYGNLAVDRENLANALNAKMYLFFRGADLAIFPLLKGKHVYEKAFKKIDKVAFRNENLKELAIHYSFNSKTPHQQIFNRINCQKFNPKNYPGGIYNPIRIVSVSRLHWRKGLPHLILALKQLKNKGFSTQTKIIGEGDEFEHLFYLVKTLGLEDQIEFKGGMPEDLVKEEMEKSDILVHPSLFESNGRVLLEAQAIGLLVLSSNWDGVENILRDKITGWLFNKRDPKDLFDKLEFVINQPFKTRKRAAENAIEHIKTNFNLKNSFNDFQHFFLNPK